MKTFLGLALWSWVPGIGCTLIAWAIFPDQPWRRLGLALGLVLFLVSLLHEPKSRRRQRADSDGKVTVTSSGQVFRSSRDVLFNGLRKKG